MDGKRERVEVPWVGRVRVAAVVVDDVMYCVNGEQQQRAAEHPREKTVLFEPRERALLEAAEAVTPGQARLARSEAIKDTGSVAPARARRRTVFRQIVV